LKPTVKTPVAHWVRKRKSLGQEYAITVLEHCARIEDLDEAERFHIEYLRSLGLPLLNVTDGGGGIRGFKHSPESIAHMRAVHTTPEALARSSATHKGKPKSPEQCARMSASSKGKPKSAEHSAKVSATWKEKMGTPEGQAHVRAFIESSHTPEVAAKISDAQRARMTPEVRASMSAQKKEAAQTPEGQARMRAMCAAKTSETFVKTVATKRAKALQLTGSASLSSVATIAAHARTPETFAKIAATKRANALAAKLAGISIITTGTLTDLNLFDGIDWSKSNMFIGRQAGVAGKTVAVVRKRLGIASSTHVAGAGRPPVPNGRFTDVDWNLTNYAIAKNTGIGRHAVKRARQRLTREVL
jgi:hypothetical protein